MEKMKHSEMLKKECRCLFCGKTFTVGEMEFCVDVPQDDTHYDQQFSEQICRYKDGGACEIPYRVWIDWSDESAVLSWDEEEMPLKVRGPLRNVKKSEALFSNTFFSLEGTAEKEPSEESTEDRQIVRESSIRVCPHCHMTVPKGIMTEEKVHVGLMGGTRSGKTTYMVVAAKYLQQRFSSMKGGVGLGTVSFVRECETYIESLYKENGIQATVALQSDIETTDQPVLPVILRIKPADTAYKPFLLILQDIPGEYMRPEPSFKEMLLSSGIKDSTDLIMLVDVNHFVETKQKEDKTKYGEYCEMETNRLCENLENLGSILKKEQIRSIQIALTKLDLWMDSEQRLAGTVFSRSCDEAHQGAISVRRLSQVDAQLRAVMEQLYQCSLIEEMSLQLGIGNAKETDGFETDSKVRKMYSTVASRTVPDHEEKYRSAVDVDYQLSLNVLEPLLNIFVAHGLLPAKTEPFLKK